MDKIRNYLLNNNIYFKDINKNDSDMYKVKQAIRVQVIGDVILVIAQFNNNHYRIYDPKNYNQRNKALKSSLITYNSLKQDEVIDFFIDVLKKIGIKTNKKTTTHKTSKNKFEYNKIENLDYALNKAIENGAGIFYGLNDALKKAPYCNQYYLIQDENSNKFLEDSLKFNEYYTDGYTDALLFYNRKVGLQMNELCKENTKLRTLRKSDDKWLIVPLIKIDNQNN